MVYVGVTMIPFRHDDQEAVMAELGDLVPIILQEAMDSGFHNYRASRALDPLAHADYTAGCAAGMLVDRISAVSRDLVSHADDGTGQVAWRISQNKRATEIVAGKYLAVRIKRTKKRRRGRSASYPTQRQINMKSPEMLPQGQMIFDGLPPTIQLDDGKDRLWLTAAYDLDDVEEKLTLRCIGVETRSEFLWRWPLPEQPTDVIASISPILADRVTELRQARSA